MDEESSERSPGPVPRRLGPKQQRKVLQACISDIHTMLDMEQVFPYLYEKNLLTDSEQDQLLSSNPYLSRKEKISKLITLLPRKGSDALSRFVECLKCSTQGTAHKELAYKIEILAEDLVNVDEPKKTTKFRFMYLHIAIILLIIAAASIILYESDSVTYNIPEENSNSLPHLSDHFVGREREIKELSNLLDFETSTKEIVSIIGSPGIGKSALAIHVGHHMLTRGVSAVIYVNLEDIPLDSNSLAEMILQSANVDSTTFDSLLQWISEISLYNLIILDNYYDYEESQSAIEKMVEKSRYIKILMTSHEVMGKFEKYKLYELSTKAAYDLLQESFPNSTTSEKEDIVKLTGNVPLALQIVCSLSLHHASPRSIISILEKDPILLTPQLLPESRYVNASFNLSFNLLSSAEKLAGVVLADCFQSSFSVEEALPHFLHSKMEEYYIVVMQKLVQQSLLKFDELKKRYFFNWLIRQLFLQKAPAINKDDLFTSFFDILSRKLILWLVDFITEN